MSDFLPRISIRWYTKLFKLHGLKLLILHRGGYKMSIISIFSPYSINYYLSFKKKPVIVLLAQNLYQKRLHQISDINNPPIYKKNVSLNIDLLLFVLHIILHLRDVMYHHHISLMLNRVKLYIRMLFSICVIFCKRELQFTKFNIW